MANRLREILSIKNKTYNEMIKISHNPEIYIRERSKYRLNERELDTNRCVLMMKRGYYRGRL